MAPPFASTKAKLLVRMRSTALPLPVQRFSNNNLVILMLDLKLRSFSGVLLLHFLFVVRNGENNLAVPHLQVFKHIWFRW